MTRFVVRRVFETIPLLLLLSLLVFLLFELIPGDFLSDMELDPTVSAETIQQLREDYGLESPFYLRYFIWAGQVLRGNLGYSFAQRRPAIDLVMERLLNTSLLALSAFLLAILLSFPLGVLCAVFAGNWPDRAGLMIAFLGLALPPVLSSLPLLYLAFWTGWFPIGGTEGLRSLVLPSLALALPTMAFLARTIRIEMIAALGEPYTQVAIAQGLPGRRVLARALRNALNPTISVMGLILGGLLSGAVVVEKVFSWPGLGSLTVDSLLSRDFFVLLNCVLVGALFVIMINLVTDLVLAWSDPRIRYR